MVDVIYTVDKQCALCGSSFSVTKVRSRLRMVKQDKDFCTYYKEINPYYYTVWVCPHCGYAAQDTYFGELSNAAEKSLHDFLDGRQIHVDFAGERTREQAIDAFKLAIFYSEMAHALSSQIAGLYLKLAWLYREGQQQEEEQLALVKAREFYEDALMREPLPIGNMTETTIEYLLGVLYFETYKLDLSLQYLGKVVANPKAKLEKRILNLARETWHEARAVKQRQAADEKMQGVLANE